MWLAEKIAGDLGLDVERRDKPSTEPGASILTHSAIRVRRFNPPSHLVSEGATHNKESKDDRDIQKHTAAWPC